MKKIIYALATTAIASAAVFTVGAPANAKEWRLEAMNLSWQECNDRGANGPWQHYNCVKWGTTDTYWLYVDGCLSCFAQLSSTEISGNRPLVLVP